MSFPAHQPLDFPYDSYTDDALIIHALLYAVDHAEMYAGTRDQAIRIINRKYFELAMIHH